MLAAAFLSCLAFLVFLAPYDRVLGRRKLTDCHLTKQGTAWIAQAGAILFLVLVWVAVFLNPLLPLVSPHPLLQSAGVFTLTQSILILQPTWTAGDKAAGQRAHASLNLLSFLIFLAGTTVIEVNKLTSNGDHFHSVHGYLGVATAIVLLAQYLFGFLIWGVPVVFGGLDQAKSLWRFHRWSGYLLYPLVLATVISATQTSYNESVLGIKLWSVIVTSVLLVVGIYPRLSITKLGISHRRH